MREVVLVVDDEGVSQTVIAGLIAAVRPCEVRAFACPLAALEWFRGEGGRWRGRAWMCRCPV